MNIVRGSDFCQDHFNMRYSILQIRFGDLLKIKTFVEVLEVILRPDTDLRAGE